MQEDDGRARIRSGMQPITKVSIGQIVGLLKAIEEVGGEADVAEIGRTVEMDLDSIGHVVDASEFLGLARAQEGRLTITDLGRKVLNAGLRQRKALVRDIIRSLPVFQGLMDRLVAAGRPLQRQEVLAAIERHIGSHDAPTLFNALVAWGRYVELLSYDSRSELLSVRTPTPLVVAPAPPAQPTPPG